MMHSKVSALGRVCAWVLLGGVALGGLWGCASQGNRVERWEMVRATQPATNPPPSAQPGGANRVSAVFLRKAGAGQQAADPVNLYINGQYQTSLVGDAFTQISLCPGTHRLMAAFKDYEKRYVSKQTGANYQVNSDAVQYFLIEDGDRQPLSIEPIDAQRAAVTVPSIERLQSHIVSRVVNDGCPAGRG